MGILNTTPDSFFDGGNYNSLDKALKKVEKDLFQFCKKNIDKYRRLSVRECARIQTFPDDFVFFYEQVADAYKMIGNAVPVKLAEALGVEIKSQLFAP